MIKFRLVTRAQTLVIISVLLLSACGATPAEVTTPTVDANAIRTEAVSTFIADLTLTALAAPPTNTPVSTVTPAPTFPPLATSTGGTPFGSAPTTAPVGGTTGCYGLRFVSDVSVPDNTTMTPGQTFTKTWKVLNAGTCAWDAGFKFAFVGGEQLNGTTQTLSASVAAGATFDISVPMTAPTNRTGTLRGNWRMSTASGQFFGDEVYVQIVVGGSGPTSTGGAPTSTNTTGAPAVTDTATATATP
ncbi:MAG TPA: NBR1-Ig-like domain-containing protein [Anaerolineales bacterium]|nr:NBR1-Ig-like domain-containing protein [Anaerolineales bacterium]